MRILIGGMNHESNTLNPIITGEEDFVVYRGKEILNNVLPPNSAAAGIIKTLREADVEVIPTIVARAVPNGVVSNVFYEKIKTEFLESAAAALREGSIDGICLALHGSMKVEGLGCAEEDLTMALRKIFPGVPMIAALDMHATITPGLLEAVDGFAGYKTAPHIDSFETGSHAARMLLKALKEGVKIRTVHQKIPVMIAGEKTETAVEPMLSLIAACRNAEGQSGIEAVSLLLGFPWADDAHNAVSVLVSYSDNRETAEKTARDIAASFWEKRNEFKFRSEFYDTREALAAAYKYAEKGEAPVFLSDSGDNPTAGAAGDATDLLEEIIRTMDRTDKLPTPLLYSGFFDAPAAEACINAGAGAEIEITIGGNWDMANGKKIPLRVKVLNTVRSYSTYNSDLVLVSHRNVHIVITSKHIGFGDPGLLPALGINPADYCLVAVKLGYLEPCFESIAARAILATTRGCSNEVLESIPYKKVSRPIFPLDQNFSWQPE